MISSLVVSYRHRDEAVGVSIHVPYPATRTTWTARHLATLVVAGGLVAALYASILSTFRTLTTPSTGSSPLLFFVAPATFAPLMRNILDLFSELDV